MAVKLPTNEQVAFQQPTGGAPPNLGSVPTDDIIKAGAAIGQQVGAIIDGMNELEDFAYEQEAEIQLRNTQIQANLDVQERLQLPDGHERAFFDAKGNYKPVVMQNIMHQHGKSLASLSGLPMSTGRRLALAGKVAQVGLGMIESFTLAGLDTQRKRALGNFETNYRLALETGDYGGAEQAAYDGVKAGLYSEAQGNLLAFQARKRGAVEGLVAMVIEAPRAAITELDSGKYDAFLSPADSARLRKQASNAYEVASQRGEANVLALTDSDIKGWAEASSEADRISRLAAASRGTALPKGTEAENLLWQNLVINPNDKNSRAALLELAHLEARSQKSGTPDPEDHEAFLNRYTRFGIFSTEDIEKIWQDGQKFIRKAASPSIEVDKRLTALFDSGSYENPEEWAKIMAEINAEGACAPPSDPWFSEAKPAGKLYQQYERLVRKADDGEGNIPEDEMKFRIAERRLKTHRAEKRQQIVEAYNAWRASDEGQGASVFEQYSQLDSICERVLGREGGVVLTPIESSALTAADAALIRQREAAEAFAAEHQRTQPFVFPTLEKPIAPFKTGVQASFAPAGDALNLTEMRLPKSMSEGVAAGKTQLHIRMPGSGKAMVATVVGFYDGDTPQLSDELSVYLGLQPGDTRAVDLQMLSPVAAERLGQMQAERQSRLMPQGAINREHPQLVNSGLAPYLDVFEEAGERYGIDPNLLLAISINETGWGTSRAFRTGNNAMGISDRKGWTSQTSVSASIHRMAHLMANSPLYAKWRDSGRDLSVLQSIYAPTEGNVTNDPDKLNRGWLRGVSSVYKQLTGKEYGK